MILLLRLLPWILGAAGIAGASAWTTHRFDGARYEAQVAEFAKYREQVQADNATAQRAADQALEAEFDQRKTAEVTNAQVRESLQSQLDATARDRDFAVRLLQHAQNARTSAGSHPIAEAPRGSQANAASTGQGDQPLIDDLTNAAFECRSAILTLIALQDEIRPQL